MRQHKLTREQELLWRTNAMCIVRDGIEVRPVTEKEKKAIISLHDAAKNSFGMQMADVTEDVVTEEEGPSNPETGEATVVRKTTTRKVRISIEKRVRDASGGSYWETLLGEFDGRNPPKEFDILEPHRNIFKRHILAEIGILRNDIGDEVGRTNVQMRRRNGQILTMCRWEPVPRNFNPTSELCKCSTLDHAVKGQHHPTCKYSADSSTGIVHVPSGPTPIVSQSKSPTQAGTTIQTSTGAIATTPVFKLPWPEECSCRHFGAPVGSDWSQGCGRHHPQCGPATQWQTLNPGQPVPSKVATPPVAEPEHPKEQVAEPEPVSESPKNKEPEPLDKDAKYLVNLDTNEVIRPASTVDIKMAEAQNPGTPLVKIGDKEYGILTAEEVEEAKEEI